MRLKQKNTLTDVLYCESVDITPERGEIFTNLTVTKSSRFVKVIKTVGCVDIDFTCGRLQFHVVDHNAKPLLGLTDSIKLSLVHLGPDVHALQQDAPELSEYKDVFDCNTIGKLPMVYHMHLDNSIHPTICAPRQIPIAMKDDVVKELERMTRLGVIAPMEEATEWVSAMVAARKKDGSVRLCIDPVHLNKALLRPRHVDFGRFP
ncbi:hypothetical protein NFI96_009335 [Prochilodus magdalenae]|nr:hypothetical protein NFI96_009335 [Prochilodus magdalenae]